MPRRLAAAQPPASCDVDRPSTHTKAEEYIRRLVADWPPLSDEQRAHISSLLRPSARTAVAA